MDIDREWISIDPLIIDNLYSDNKRTIQLYTVATLVKNRLYNLFSFLSLLLLGSSTHSPFSLLLLS